MVRDVDMQYRSINIIERHVYEAHDGQTGELRPHWTTRHQAEEIEEALKAARAHRRHYKDGRVVNVAQSKPRNYAHLKDRQPLVKRLTMGRRGTHTEQP